MLLLDLASDFASLLEGQAVDSRLQLLSHLLAVCLGQAVHNATLHPPHAVHKLVTDHASNVLHAISKLGLLLPYLISAIPCKQTFCESCVARSAFGHVCSALAQMQDSMLMIDGGGSSMQRVQRSQVGNVWAQMDPFHIP